MRKLVIVIVALLALITFIREWSNFRASTSDIVGTELGSLYQP